LLPKGTFRFHLLIKAHVPAFVKSIFLFIFLLYFNGQRLTLSEYILLAITSLFVIVDPLATAPAFLAMTPTDTPEQRLRTAGLASFTTAVVLLAFALAGTELFKIFSITMPAFQIAASIILMLIALDMLRAQRSRVQQTSEETQAGVEKTDIAVTPLAIPMLAGPGAISMTISLQNQAKTAEQHFALYGCILVVSLASYVTFRLAVKGARWLNPIAMSIAIRVMGLLLAAVAIQFMLNGIKEFHADLMAPVTSP
jgi:multiple antibiotic resistance protein